MSVHRDMTGICKCSNGKDRSLMGIALLSVLEAIFSGFFNLCDRGACRPGFLNHKRCERILSWWDALAEKFDFDAMAEKVENVELSGRSRRFLRELYEIAIRNLRNLDRRVLTPVDDWLKNAVSKAGAWKDEVIDFYTFAPPAPVVRIRITRQFNLAGPETIAVRKSVVNE